MMVLIRLLDGSMAAVEAARVTSIYPVEPERGKLYTKVDYEDAGNKLAAFSTYESVESVAYRVNFGWSGDEPSGPPGV